MSSAASIPSTVYPCQSGTSISQHILEGIWTILKYQIESQIFLILSFEDREIDL